MRGAVKRLCICKQRLPCRAGKAARMARLTTCSRKRVGCNNEPTLDRTALEQLKYRTVAGDRHPCPAGQLGLPQQSFIFLFFAPCDTVGGRRFTCHHRMRSAAG